ncbi:MAG: hypothetical protein ABIB97_02580 [Patescibacteria group bacterium]
MTPKVKKILIIVAYIVTAIFMAFVIYWTFFGDRDGGGEVVNVNGRLVNLGPDGTLPNINTIDVSNLNYSVNTNQVVSANTNAALPDIADVATGSLTKTTKLNDDIAYYSTTSIDGSNMYYYDREDGLFYVVSAEDGSLSLLTAQKFHSVENVTWSPTKDKAIIEFPDGTKIMYDFRNNKQYTLPEQYEEVDFAETGREIVFKYMGEDEDDRFLAIANPDGTGMQVVEQLSDRADSFEADYSPSGQVVGFYKESTTGESQEVYFIGKYGENFKSLSVNGKGFESQWSSDGEQLVYSVYNSGTNYNPTLWLAGAQGESIGENKINTGLQTWADKCAISGSTAICGVPTSLERGSGPFPELSSSSPDVFYQVDLNSGNSTPLAIPVYGDGTGQFQVKNIHIDESGRYMYFTDGFTGKLHKIQIEY